MSNLKENFATVFDIIEELNKIEVDGEIMQYILQKTGMEW